MVSMPVSGNSNHNSYVGDDGSGLGQVALLFGGCRGDGTRVARNEAFVLDLAGSGGGGTGGAGQDGVAGDRGEGDGLDSDDAQVVVTSVPAETTMCDNHQHERQCHRSCRTTSALIGCTELHRLEQTRVYSGPHHRAHEG